MKRITILFAVLAVFLWVGSAMGLELGNNITIPDGVSSGSGWYGAQEDQEVEPNCVPDQTWDLEGFFLNGTTLTMVGGFDFQYGNDGYQSGDIFIDTNDNAVFGASNTGSQTTNGYQNIQSSFGYDYAINLNFTNKTYDLYSLTDLSTVLSVYYAQNSESNPLEYVSGGNQLTGGSFDYYTGLGAAEVGNLQGGTHNAVVIDLSDLISQGADLQEFIAHFAIGCGNDNLMGEGSAPVPEPATMLLLGVGLCGLAFVGRKKLIKHG